MNTPDTPNMSDTPNMRDIPDVSGKEARKYDAGKPPITLVPRALIEGAARAFAFGAKKYARFNYREGKGLSYSRLADSCMRHLIEFMDGCEIDPESGLDPLDHAAAALGMLMDTKRRTKVGRLPFSTDDRWKEKT